MSYELAELIAEMKAAIAAIELGDARINSRVDEIKKAVNEVLRKIGRPGENADYADFERKSASEMCAIRHAERVPKDDGVIKAYLADDMRERAARGHGLVKLVAQRQGFAR
jgi:hypothetical protein